MKKEKKGFTDDMKIGTVGTLLQRINEEYEKRREEVAVQDRANAELLKTAKDEETRLIDEISKSKGIVKKMIDDYVKIEADVVAEAKKKAEANVLRESDVKSGKISLAAFRKEGKFDKEIQADILKKSVPELEESLKVIRSLKLEILEQQEKLGDCRNTIRNLILRPGITMLEMLKGLYDFTDMQVADFMGELESLRTGWNQIKEKINWTKGRAIAPYYRWDGLTLEQARAVIFDPILPLSCVGRLKSEIEKFKDAESLNIAYYLRTKEVSVESIKFKRALLQTSDLKEDPNAEFKKIK